MMISRVGFRKTFKDALISLKLRRNRTENYCMEPQKKKENYCMILFVCRKIELRSCLKELLSVGRNEIILRPLEPTRYILDSVWLAVSSRWAAGHQNILSLGGGTWPAPSPHRGGGGTPAPPPHHPVPVPAVSSRADQSTHAHQPINRLRTRRPERESPH